MAHNWLHCLNYIPKVHFNIYSTVFTLFKYWETSHIHKQQVWTINTHISKLIGDHLGSLIKFHEHFSGQHKSRWDHNRCHSKLICGFFLLDFQLVRFVSKGCELIFKEKSSSIQFLHLSSAFTESWHDMQTSDGIYLVNNLFYNFFLHNTRLS